MLRGTGQPQLAQLNLGLDPVINCQELVEMLEDFDLLPRYV